MARVTQIFQIELPLRRLFESPTIEGLAGDLALAWGGEEILEKVAQTFRQMESLSEEQVRAMVEMTSSAEQT
jgi:hypothetical protein